MTKPAPLDDDAVETLLHETLRQLSVARFVAGAETEEGAEALRIAMVGPLSALMRIEKARNGQADAIDKNSSSSG